MQQNYPGSTNEIERFWDRYIKPRNDRGVNLNLTKWYVIRSEQYIKTFRKPFSVMPEDRSNHGTVSV